MKNWNAPVVEELNVTLTAGGEPIGCSEKTIQFGCIKVETWGPEKGEDPKGEDEFTPGES